MRKNKLRKRVRKPISVKKFQVQIAVDFIMGRGSRARLKKVLSLDPSTVRFQKC